LEWREVAKNLSKSITKSYPTLWNLFQWRVLGKKKALKTKQKQQQKPGKIQSVLASQLRELDCMHSRPIPDPHF